MAEVSPELTKGIDTTVGVVPYEGGQVKEERKDVAPTKTQNSRATLSAYMTIAAAAFGLISDGCRCILREFGFGLV